MSAHAEKGREMTNRRRLALAVAAAMAVTAWLGAGTAAHAAFPNFAGCTATEFNEEACINVQNRSGNLNIKGFNVPLGESLEIRGTLVVEPSGPVFVPPRGTTGFFARAVPVPGGLLGIDWIPGNDVLAITELAGSPSQIAVDVVTNSIRIPLKVRLVNLLLGMNCHIGTDRNPVSLNLITGTTSPPAPNRPISGRVGEVAFTERGIVITGNVNVENSFAVPGASSCGLGLGLINTLVNLKLGLPSAGGNNSIQVVNDVAFGI
jgi:hypothetical protein